MMIPTTQNTFDAFLATVSPEANRFMLTDTDNAATLEFFDRHGDTLGYATMQCVGPQDITYALVA